MKDFLIALWIVFVFSALTLLIWHEVKSHNTSANKPAKTLHSEYSCLLYAQ
ncbi:MAG TPA: hypothetical protein VK174_04695 [Chitinophagales bacterium]|nr:hypothetical protein [Chitinophagales bacterium]